MGSQFPDQGSNPLLPALEAENLNPCTKKEVSDVSLDVISFTQFAHEITERETGEKFWSSVNFLFFISINTSLI